jgi:hypothetical protein
MVSICFMMIFVLDAVLEASVIMRLGFYEHTGSSFPFLDGYYGHNALRNIVFVALAVTAGTCLRFFVSDRGETLVERGAHKLGTTGVKPTILRFLAVLAAIQAILMLGYHVPIAITTLVTPNAAWHADMVENSYLNDHICGYGTPRTCPQG